MAYLRVFDSIVDLSDPMTWQKLRSLCFSFAQLFSEVSGVLRQFEAASRVSLPPPPPKSSSLNEVSRAVLTSFSFFSRFGTCCSFAKRLWRRFRCGRRSFDFCSPVSLSSSFVLIPHLTFLLSSVFKASLTPRPVPRPSSPSRKLASTLWTLPRTFSLSSPSHRPKFKT